jgi:hypothetical protein
MWRWRIRHFFIIAGACGLLSFCGFVDLRPIGFSTSPADMNEMLPGEYSPTLLEFDTEMIRRDAETAMQINAETGAVEGDYIWAGNCLRFVPSGGWKPGIRYTLSLTGTVYSQDGRELRLNRHIPFYALSRAPHPLVESFSPPDGASVAPGAAGGCVAELRFSRPMNRSSVETAFTMEGLGARSFVWDDDSRLLRVIAEKALVPWTLYRWTLGTGAASREGVSLAKSFSARFCTDGDRVFPQVLNVFPLIQSGPRWLPLAGSMDAGLGPEQAVGIEFSKTPGENFSGHIRFEPSLSGRFEKISSSTVIFIPDRNAEPETTYTLIVSGELQDTGGLKMGADYSLNFKTVIPFLRILSLTVDGVPPLVPDESRGGSLGDPLAAPVDIAEEGALRFTIHFSLPIAEAAKQDLPFRVSLSPYFPGTLPPIALRAVSWLSGDRLRMEWTGLKPGTPGEKSWYLLSFPGGKGGINNGGGMYLNEDKFLYLEAVN